MIKAILIFLAVTNLYERNQIPTKAARPINKLRNLVASNGSISKNKKGTSSHEKSGPQHPLIAFLKSPFKYFLAIEIYEIPSKFIWYL